MAKKYSGPRLRAEGKNGEFYIVWFEDGHTKRLSTRTANLPEAQRILAGYLLEKEQDAERGDRWTVKQVFDYYDANHIEEKVVDKKRHRKALSYLRDIIGEDRFMDELASDDFTTYRQTRRRTKVHGRHTNNATIRRELVVFIAAANFAVKNRKIENRHVPIISLPDHNAAKDRFLERPEAQTLLGVMQPVGANRLTRVYRFAAIGLSAPKRRQAIEVLKWFQVDLKNRVIDFRRPGEPETKKRRGRCPISDWLLPILERAYQEKTSEYVLDTPYCITRDFRAAAEAAGMPDVTPHTLRHTWGTWAAQGGASMWQIAGMMGCTVATAERNYLHHSPAHLRGVADKVSPEIMNVAAPVVDASQEAVKA